MRSCFGSDAPPIRVQYALASGLIGLLAYSSVADQAIKRAFTRFGKWAHAMAEPISEKPEPASEPLLPGFADIFDLCDG